jgi:hypothetical protein
MTGIKSSKSRKHQELCGLIGAWNHILDGVLAHASVAATGEHHNALASDYHVCGEQEPVGKHECWLRQGHVGHGSDELILLVSGGHSHRHGSIREERRAAERVCLTHLGAGYLHPVLDCNGPGLCGSTCSMHDWA